MTLVGTTPRGTTPPPRLPVREKSTARHRAGTGLSPMLTRLAAERATGVLERERGSLYLAEGRVVHAESPYAPGLDVLLLTHGTLDPTVWREAVERADQEYGAARLLLDAGRIPRGALELCHLGALYDAAYFALAPSSAPGRFVYGAGHWLGALRPVPVDALERETLRRRELLERLWPDPLADGAPLLRSEAVAAPAATARQNAVLALVNGVRTASDIARELGRQAFHTLVDVRRLAAAGLLSALLPPPPPVAPAAPDPPRGIPMPRVNDPDITLLKRLRDALEAL
ncbi:hypothetical protein JCM4814A_71860 [Streptomyces phaeofaciens JCM 4814]|uniref:Uncharacterized protein n=1 Tax=Streptomyces phaeofaciens TaxID=68254 RepID=A0A918LWC9_9ACTN|nr:transcriptional regulator [Streptomyces phaeofaciens]GGT61790.1 hypothetical protein GCM10010226_44330 [Streptomyces phaeofaciens]